MSEKLIIKELYEILDQFTKPDFDIETKIGRKITDFIKRKFKDKKWPSDSPLQYEDIAFAFGENSDHPEEWGDVFYRPQFARIDSITKKYHSCFPNIKQITPEILSYWEKTS